MGLDVWFREDVARILAAVAIARDGLTSDERTLLAAIGAGFGLSLAEILSSERRAMLQLPATAQGGWLVEQPAVEERESARRFIQP